MRSMWVIPDANNMRTPLLILKEQANALTEATGGSLQGTINTITKANSSDIYITLTIVVPALNHYRYSMISYEQPITLYPGFLRTAANTYEIKDEATFVRTLQEMLSSYETQKILAGLLAQSNVE